MMQNDDWQEYESDGDPTEWNIKKFKNKQAQGQGCMNKRQKTGDELDGMNEFEKFDYLLKDRFYSKMEQKQKYQTIPPLNSKQNKQPSSSSQDH